MGKLSFSASTPYSRGHASCRVPRPCPMGHLAPQVASPCSTCSPTLGDRNLLLGPGQPLVGPGTETICHTPQRSLATRVSVSTSHTWSHLYASSANFSQIPNTKTARMSSRILNCALHAIRTAPVLSSAKQSGGVRRPRRSGIALHLPGGVLPRPTDTVWAVVPVRPSGSNAVLETG